MTRFARCVRFAHTFSSSRSLRHLCPWQYHLRLHRCTQPLPRRLRPGGEEAEKALDQLLPCDLLTHTTAPLQFAIDSAALSLITTHINDNPDLYPEGLAWGGERGMTVGGVRPGWGGNTDGLWAQRLVGKGWNSSLSADDLCNLKED